MGLIDEAFKRSPRNNSFGDAAAASLDSRVSQIPTGGLKAPAPDGSQNNPLNTDIGRNVNNTMMALPGVGGLARAASTGGAISSGINAASSGVNAASRMAAFGSGVAAAGPASAQAPAPASTTAPSEQVGAGAGRGVVNPSMAEPSKPLPQPGPANAPSGAEVMPGVYQHGRGQYSDSAAGMGMPAGFTGKPSAQNLAAADNMDRPRGLVAYAALNPPDNLPKNTVPLIQAATVAHSGNSWSAQNALRNAQVSASSIMNNGGSWDKHKGVSPERAYAAAMENADFAARGAQPGMEQAAMRENAATQREGMQQAGSTARAQMMEVGQNNRFGQTQGLARDKLAMEQETQGFSNRAAAQSEQLRNTLLDPKATPEQRSIAQRNLAALSGKTAADQMQTVALPDTTTDTGQVVRGGQALVRTLEDGTVVQVPVGAAQQGGAQPLPPGMKRQVGTSNGRPVYEDMNGKQVIAKG